MGYKHPETIEEVQAGLEGQSYFPSEGLALSLIHI